MPRITAIHDERGRPRSCDSGRRNAGTPFEIASTPVSATAPDEKPFNNKKMPSVPPVCAHAFRRERAGLNGTVSTPPNQPKYVLREPEARRAT